MHAHPCTSHLDFVKLFVREDEILILQIKIGRNSLENASEFFIFLFDFLKCLTNTNVSYFDVQCSADIILLKITYVVAQYTYFTQGLVTFKMSGLLSYLLHGAEPCLRSQQVLS